MVPEENDNTTTHNQGTVPGVRPEDQAYAIKSKKYGKYNALYCFIFAAIGIVMYLVFGYGWI